MIQPLFEQLTNTWAALVAAQTPAPTLTLTPGELEFSQCARDRSSQPRPQEVQETLALNLPATTRYPLAQPPLAGSLHGQAIFQPGTRDERRLALTAAVDYTVDLAPPALLLTTGGQAKVAGATHLRLGYTRAGVFVTQEFCQHFQAEVCAATWPQVEQWAGIFLALLLTEHDAWLEEYNRAQATPYTAGRFVSRPVLEHLTIRAGTPVLTGERPLLGLRGEAAGHLELGQTTATFGLIEQVISPGLQAGQQAVAIAVNVL